MKYIIEIENEPFGRNDDPVIPHGMDELYRAKGFKSLVFDKNGLAKLIPYTEPDRKAIEDEVWHLARTIESMSVGEIMNIFDVREENVPFLCNTRTYQEAKSKFEAWLKQKDSKPRFCNEVEDDSGIKAVVMDTTPEGEIIVFTENGCVERWGKYHKSKKTGRYFSEVIGMLQKMRGEEE